MSLVSQVIQPSCLSYFMSLTRNDPHLLRPSLAIALTFHTLKSCPAAATALPSCIIPQPPPSPCVSPRCLCGPSTTQTSLDVVPFTLQCQVSSCHDTRLRADHPSRLLCRYASTSHTHAIWITQDVLDGGIYKRVYFTLAPRPPSRPAARASVNTYSLLVTPCHTSAPINSL